ncbi:MAG: hypothetical protein WCS89_02910 [Candidatus Paceibacterota bacterium]
MKKFTAEEIQAQFEKLPKELQSAITSPEINETIQNVAKKYSLQVDQLGELVDLIGLIMLGIISSKNFIKEFSNETGLSEDISKAIAEDINREVFDKIRSYIRETDEEKNAINEPQNSQLGIETPPTEPTPPIQPPSTTPTLKPINPIILPPAVETPKSSHVLDLEKAGNMTIENEPNSTKTEEYKEPLADHLLEALNDTSSEKSEDVAVKPISKVPTMPEVSIKKEVVQKPAPPIPANLPTENSENATPPIVQAVPQKPKGADLYREPF